MMDIKDLQVSQFYISNKKIEEIEKWFKDDLSNFEAIPYKILNGRYVMTDGHTRAVVAIMHGINNIPCVEDMDELSLDMYEECVKECLKQGIHSPYDLVNRIVDEDSYHKLWDKWCDKMQEEIINRRNNKVSN